MRCKACNKRLDDVDMTRKDPETGEYLDLCGRCRKVSNAVLDGTFVEPPSYDHDDLGPLHSAEWDL